MIVCGTRGAILDEVQMEYILKQLVPPKVFNDKFIIMHGACPDSADEVAEKIAQRNNWGTAPYPSNSGNYLKRNIEMVGKLEQGDIVLAFWDGFSYGTAHTIATAVMRDIDVTVYKVKKR